MSWSLLMQRGAMMRGAMLVVVICALTALIGCSSADAESTQAEETEEADLSIRFPTADSLVAHLNQLVTETPIDLLGVLDLYYPETELQRELLDLERLMYPLLELEHQGFQRFGESIRGMMRVDPLGAIPPVVIEEYEGRRVRALTTDVNQREFEFHLIEMDQEWYISGYTSKYALMREGDPATMVQELRPQIEAILPAVNTVLPRVRNGEIRTANQAHQVLRLHMMAGQ